MTSKAPPSPPPKRPTATAPGVASRATPATLAVAEPKFEPPRICLNAVAGFGKTSAGAFAEGAAILMAAGETGYRTLLSAKRVPAIPSAVIESWPQLLATVDDLINQSAGIKLLILDAMGGFEDMCHQYVCDRDYGGDWGEKGFTGFQRGYDVSVKDWLGLLSRLDRLREKQGVALLLLSHSQVRNFKNPSGPDFDRYVTNMHHKTSDVTRDWADAVLFGNFLTVIDKPKGGRAKGIGGTDRVIYTERRDAFDAKNRYGMQESFMLSNDPAETWSIITNAMKGES